MPHRILYFHHAIGLGGAPRSLAFLIAGLDHSEFEPMVVMPKRSGNDAVKQLFLDAGAQVIEEQHIRPFSGSTVSPCNKLKDRAYAALSYPLLVRCAERLVRDIRPDVIHLNSTCLVAAAKGSHVASSSSPVIAHVREPLLQNWWGRILARLNRKHVDYYIGIDQYGLDSIGATTKNGTKIYNFIDQVEFSPSPSTFSSDRQIFGFQPNEVIFLSLSRVAKSNGALELARMVLDCDHLINRSAKFVIAGFSGKPSGYALEARDAMQGNPRFIIMDFVTDVVSLLNATDVVVAPFTTPHSARSVFEGAAMATPALVSNLPNLIELIDLNKTGFEFDWSDTETFVDGVNRLCEPELRKEMGQAASEFAAGNFDSKKNVEKTMQVYRDLLAKK